MRSLYFNILKFLMDNKETLKEDFYLNPYSKVGFSDLHNLENINKLYYNLADNESKNNFVRLILFRIARLFLPENLANNKYPPIDDALWSKALMESECLDNKQNNFAESEYLQIKLLEGYDYQDCTVEGGDVVFDIGGFTGLSSMHFADKAGESGLVYSFEANPNNFFKLKSNIAKYSNITPVNLAISDFNGEGFISDFASSSEIGKNGLAVQFRSIDSFVQENEIKKVDFIKMDIEGAEVEALNGCAQTIKKHQPKLAISVYHKPDDIFSIYELINSIGGRYNFYFKHSGRFHQESVLFAFPERLFSHTHTCQL